jgi:hypothetical protein
LDLKKGILFSLLALAMASTSLSYAREYTQGSYFVLADLLYWQVREGSNDNWGQLISPVGTANPNVVLLKTNFNWNAGFRIGGGYINPSNWDTQMYYTAYQTQAAAQAAGIGQIYSPYIGNFFQNNTNGKNNGPFYDAAQMRWKLAYNTVDIELGRRFQFDKILTIRPFFGLKSAIINQNIYTTWQGPNTLVNKVRTPITDFSYANENLTNYFTGIGPSFGVNTTWPLYQNTQNSFNLLGNLSAALMWGLWRFKDTYQTNNNASVTVNVDNVNGAAPMTSAFVGLEWIRSFPKADFHIRLGYEAQVWFDQVQFNTLNSGRLNDIMSLQGGVMDFSVNF